MTITHAMSIDLNWEAATSGPDGEELAERIRSFVHEKFQTVPLPRFIRSVNVHSFEFGSIAPELEIKDICDPFVDFYEEDDSDDDDDHDGDDNDTTSDASSDQATAANQRGIPRDGQHKDGNSELNNTYQDHLRTTQWVTGQDSHQSPLRSPIGLGDHLNAQFRSSTPTILPGVTSNLGYHLMMGSLSGAQTPLGAVAGATPFATTGWPDAVNGSTTVATAGGGRDNGSPSRPSTANTNPTHLSHGRSAAGSSSNNTSNDPTVIYNEQASSTTATTKPAKTKAHALKDGDQPRDKKSPVIADPQEEPAPPHMRERRPEDFQIICRVKYSGDVKLSLTAEILLDYPMPSFVGLPLKLNITGITFNGVAVVAYIRRRAHLCFLSPEDADALLGDDDDVHEQVYHHHHDQRQENHTAYATTDSTGPATSTSDDNNINNNNHHHHHSNNNNDNDIDDNDNVNNNNTHSENPPPHHKRRFGSLLQQIRVESEIGRKENGKQVLKNVGKVERFVLDQVRRIFEDEFVFPSYWTFLV